MSSLSVSASKPKVKHSGESILFGVDFTPLLNDGETISSITSIAGSPSGLTIATGAVNAAEFDNDEGGTVAVGCGAQFRVSGGTADTDYTITVTVATSGSNTRVAVCTLQVRDD